MATVILTGGNLAWAGGAPRGGHAMYILQWLYSFVAAGHRVLYVGVVDDDAAIGRVHEIVERHWRTSRTSVVSRAGGARYGLTNSEVDDFARSADMLVSVGARYRAE